jgi:ribonucleotide monophosphatase NagD (HAD superfamily)
MLCANPDIVVDMGDKRLYCAGALAQAYEEMGGTALYFGKPHPPIYDLARRRLAEAGTPADPQILCIGDGISTDIQGGIGEGLDTLFITGGLEAERFGADVENPDQARLDDWLDSRELSPTFCDGTPALTARQLSFTGRHGIEQFLRNGLFCAAACASLPA